MIDDKKVEEAAQLLRFELIASMHGSTLGTPMQCFKEEVDTETELIENSFITGAKWAINEFLKDLWHPASEEPKEGFDLVCINKAKEFREISSYNSDRFNDLFGNEWGAACRRFGIYKWAYKDDLLLKEGGEQ